MLVIIIVSVLVGLVSHQIGSERKLCSVFWQCEVYAQTRLHQSFIGVIIDASPLPSPPPPTPPPPPSSSSSSSSPPPFPHLVLLFILFVYFSYLLLFPRSYLSLSLFFSLSSYVSPFLEYKLKLSSVSVPSSHKSLVLQTDFMKLAG